MSIEDALNRFTKYTYDSTTKQVESIVRGTGTESITESITESYEYDGAGNLTKLTDGNGKLTNYEYDGMNRQTKVTKQLTSVDPMALLPLR